MISRGLAARQNGRGCSGTPSPLPLTGEFAKVTEKRKFLAILAVKHLLWKGDLPRIKCNGNMQHAWTELRKISPEVNWFGFRTGIFGSRNGILYFTCSVTIA